jgi:hypothetical protein
MPQEHGMQRTIENLYDWRYFVLMGLAIILPLSSEHLAAAVLHAVGIETMRIHPILAMALCIGVGVMLGMFPIWLYYRKFSTNFTAYLMIICGCSVLASISLNIHSYFFYLQHPRFISSLPHEMGSLFSGGFLCSLTLLYGIIQLIRSRRQIIPAL